MSKKFEVQTRFMSGEWENVWHENEKPLFFDSREEAQTAIDEFVQSCKEECAAGNLDDAMTKEDFRIREVNYE